MEKIIAKRISFKKSIFSEKAISNLKNYLRKFALFLCKIFFLPLVKAILLKVEGKKNLPKERFIFASNHFSYLDILIDGYLLYDKRFHFIAQIDGFKGFLRKIVAGIYWIFEAIPVERNNQNSKKRAILKAIEVLKKGDVLVIYPEGRRSKTGKIERGKLGIAKIFLKTGAPIVPSAILGTFEIYPPKRKFPLIKKIVKVKIGSPLYFKNELERAKNLKENSWQYQRLLFEIKEKTMKEIRKLYYEN